MAKLISTLKITSFLYVVVQGPISMFEIVLLEGDQCEDVDGIVEQMWAITNGYTGKIICLKKK